MIPYMILFVLLLNSKDTLGYSIITQDLEEDLNHDWWKYTTIYQIYLQSYMDSDGDGFGDLTGLKSKLQYLADTGIQTVWFNPIYDSPNPDYGYEITNYTNIVSRYGNLDDFVELTKEAKRLGLKITMDLLLNDCGENHPWFQKSIQSIEPYTEFFVWRDPKRLDNGNPIPPNNWLSMSGGSAWTWNSLRKQFYYHINDYKRPDFNLRNPEVIKVFKEILEFWFSKGLDGIRINGGKYLLEDNNLPDEPLKWGKWWTDNYWDMDHPYTVDRAENHELIRHFKEFVDNISRADGYTRIVYSLPASEIKDTMKYYKISGRQCTHFPLNDGLTTLPDFPKAQDFDAQISKWMINMPRGSVANWVSGNHDISRIGHKFGQAFNDIYNIMVCMLPGVAIIYYGQEIGMDDAVIYPGEPSEAYRSPMQWDGSIHSGFASSYNTWMPVNSNYWRINVESEQLDPTSHYSIFKNLMSIRKSATSKFGKLNTYVMSEWTYAFVRTLKGYDTYVVVINFGTDTEVIELKENIPHLDQDFKVLLSSRNSGYKLGQLIRIVSSDNYLFTVRPQSAIILTSDLVDAITPISIVTTEAETLPLYENNEQSYEGEYANTAISLNFNFYKLAITIISYFLVKIIIQ